MDYEGPDGVSILVLTHREHSDAVIELIALFDAIAQEQAWQPGDQLLAHAGASVYFALTVQGDLAGGLQLVVGGPDRTLPCLSVWPELPLTGRSDMADVAVFALKQAYRGRGRLFWLLLVELWRYSHTHRIEHLWMEIPPRVHTVYQRLGWPLEVAGPLRPHWGEDCYPCRVGVGDLEQVFVDKARRAPLYQDLVAQAYRDQRLAPNASRPPIEAAA